MRELEIHGVGRRRGRTRTTAPDKKAAPAPDVVKRRFTATRPDETWAADITYVPTYQGWLFLACAMDLYSRRWSTKQDQPEDDAADADLSASEQAAKAIPSPQAGPADPPETARPALPQSAPAGLETPTHHEAVA